MNREYKGLPDLPEEIEWMRKESRISGNPECDRHGRLYRPKPKQKREACPECATLLSGRCDTCGRNVCRDGNEYMDWE